ncbi:cholinesterase 1 [Ixodes scapularis]
MTVFQSDEVRQKPSSGNSCGGDSTEKGSCHQQTCPTLLDIEANLSVDHPHWNVWPNDVKEPIVETNQGKLKGLLTSVHGKPVQVYYGIPYAEPPVHQLRFRKPVPAKPWNGTLDATRKKHSCLQQFYPEVFHIETDLSEDCLYLNVWTTSTTKPTKSVIVWIHGGGFSFGSSYQSWYNGSLLATMHDVVVVTINYRIGIFGFLNAGAPEAPGNMGLLDQNLALKWVRENIRAFGGNPSRVTIFGESAGSYSVHAHIISPLSRGLFQRAFLMSGTYHSFGLLDTVFESSVRGSKVAARLNCTGALRDLTSHPDTVLECLRTKSTKEIFEAAKNVSGRKMVSFLPSYPNEFFPIRPSLALRQGQFADVDVMVSITQSEGNVILLPQTDKRFWDEDLKDVRVEDLKPALRKMVALWMKEEYEDLVEYYAAQAGQDDKRALREKHTDFVGDFYFVCPSKYFAEGHSARGNTVYSFLFGHSSAKSRLPKWMGVPHVLDLPYYFGVPFMDHGNYSDEDRRFSQEVMNAFVTFSKYGKPELDGVNWVPYTPWNPVSLWLQPGNYSMQHNVFSGNCHYWEQFLQ